MAVGNFTVKHGTTYKAQLTLSWFESFASDDMIASKFEALGFKDVVVSGDGETRYAQGIWLGPDETVPLTDEHIVSVTEVAPPVNIVSGHDSPDIIS